MAFKMYIYSAISNQMDNIKVEVGQSIQRARIAKGLTQKELGEKIGVGTPTISRYETGNQNLTVETIQKIADALGIKVNVIFYI